ncbi:MAG: hypothetical protein HC889_09295 [Synechococcaceae cyanobacterium SM1_2_3]|nr:hypothetical protein [Synechococcaceae cyanobacterium SM1_2_3]
MGKAQRVHPTKNPISIEKWHKALDSESGGDPGQIFYRHCYPRLVGAAGRISGTAHHGSGRRSIASSAQADTKKAWVERDVVLAQILCSQLQVGDHIAIEQDEMIPIDSKVIGGNAAVNLIDIGHDRRSLSAQVTKPRDSSCAIEHRPQQQQQPRRISRRYHVNF